MTEILNKTAVRLGQCAAFFVVIAGPSLTSTASPSTVATTALVSEVVSTNSRGADFFVPAGVAPKLQDGH